MKELKYICFYTIIIANSVFGFAASGQDDLTAEQLILLMKASSEQYKSISSKINGVIYQQSDMNAPKNVKSTQQIISRWTREKEFIRIVETSDILKYDPATEQVTPSGTAAYYTTYSIAPTWSSRLIEVSDNRKPRGLICSSPMLIGELPCYTLYTAMWGLSGYPWDLIKLDEAKISYDEKDGYYILRAKITDNPKGPKIRLFVDPSKGYIPVKQENLTYEDVCFSTYECKDFHQYRGELWIPYEYFSTAPAPQLNYSVFYKAEFVSVNEPIAEALLDVEFPEGTIVDDERLGTEYKITQRQKAGTITDVNRLTDVNMTGTLLSKPATDEELRSSAAKARELLVASSQTQQSIPSVEVKPQYVFVKSGKSEYTLSVKGSDEKRVGLTGYTFESEGLNLQSVKNLITQEGQIVVNVARKDGKIGFAKGILHLQFEKENVDVVFVCPPAH